MKKFWRREPLVDPNKLNQQSAEIQAKLREEGPHMNAVANYLERRKDQNGFGNDFEYTLRPRRAS